MTDKDEPQDFAAVFMQHQKGRAHAEASELLQEAVEAVKETGKAATLTVKLRIERSKDVAHIVKISDTVTASIPQEKRPASIWYTGVGDGTLHRNDPRQGSLFGEDGEEPTRHDPRAAAQTADQPQTETEA